METYKQVLDSKRSAGGYNTGVKLRGNVLVTYRQYRASISYFYIKRTVKSDGITTEPLSVVLCPRREPAHEVCDMVGKSHPLHPGRDMKVRWAAKIFNNVATLLAALITEKAPDEELFTVLSAQSQFDNILSGDVPLVFPVFERMRKEILHYIPKTLQIKASDLLDRISNAPGIAWNENGELIVNDKLIKGTHIVDLVGDLIRARKQDPPHGFRGFAEALRPLYLPSELIGNPQRLDYLRNDLTPSFITPITKRKFVVKKSSIKPPVWESLEWMICIITPNASRATVVVWNR